MKKFNLLFALLSIYFSAFSQAPIITSFSPASGPVGTLVTITGTNLSSPTAFTIGGVAAIVVSNTGSSLVGMVMPGAVMGIVSVTTGGVWLRLAAILQSVLPHIPFIKGIKW